MAVTINYEWQEPKNDYVSTDVVRPSIFNTLATNEKHLKEISCEVIVRTTGDNAGEERVSKLVFVDNKPYIEGDGGTLTEIRLIAERATSDANGNLISSTYVTKTGNEALTNKTYNGYTLGNACTKTVLDNSAATAISTTTKLPTERTIYNGLPNINGSHDYTKETNIYAPTSQLEESNEKQFLVGSSSKTSMATEKTNGNCYMQNGHLYSNNSKTINLAMFSLSGNVLTITTT